MPGRGNPHAWLVVTAFLQMSSTLGLPPTQQRPWTGRARGGYDQVLDHIEIVQTPAIERMVRREGEGWLARMGDDGMEDRWKRAIIGRGADAGRADASTAKAGLNTEAMDAGRMLKPPEEGGGWEGDGPMEMGPCVYREPTQSTCPSRLQEITSLSDCELAARTLRHTFHGAIMSHHVPSGCVYTSEGDGVYLNRVGWDEAEAENATMGPVCACDEDILPSQSAPQLLQLQTSFFSMLNDSDSEAVGLGYLSSRIHQLLNSPAAIATINFIRTANSTLHDWDGLARDAFETSAAYGQRQMFGPCFKKGEAASNCRKIRRLNNEAECKLAASMAGLSYGGEIDNKAAPSGCIYKNDIYKNDGSETAYLNTAKMSETSGTHDEYGPLCTCNGYTWQNQQSEAEMFCDFGCKPCNCTEDEIGNQINDDGFVDLCTPARCLQYYHSGAGGSQICEWVGGFSEGLPFVTDVLDIAKNNESNIESDPESDSNPFKIREHCPTSIIEYKIRHMKESIVARRNMGQDVFTDLQPTSPLGIEGGINATRDATNVTYKLLSGYLPDDTVAMLEATLPVYQWASLMLNWIMAMLVTSLVLNVLAYRPPGMPEAQWLKTGSTKKSLEVVAEDYLPGIFFTMVAKVMMVEAEKIIPQAFLGHAIYDIADLGH